MSDKGVEPDPERVAAISRFPTPKSVSDVRAFLGLANQLGSFLPDLAHATDKLRQLLTKDIAFQWLEEHQSAFQKTKDILTSPKIVHFFDRNLESVLMTDASKLNGLGFALIQLDRTGKQRLVTCGSRSLKPAEKNYAIVEIESKTIEWAISKCQHYLLGMQHFKVITDHKPLVALYSKPLDDVPNTRVQRHREMLAKYSFDVTWEAGKKHLIADALSRYPVFFTPEGQAEPDEAVVRFIAANDKVKSLVQAAEQDNEYKAIVDLLAKGVRPERIS